jgi:hypothetical protein
MVDSISAGQKAVTAVFGTLGSWGVPLAGGASHHYAMLWAGGYGWVLVKYRSGLGATEYPTPSVGETDVE